MYDNNNIFARIIRGEIPCDKVYEDEVTLAFLDIAPAAPVHALVVPKGEYVSLDDFAQKADPGEISAFFRTVREITHRLGLKEDGYRVLTNHGRNASQSVPHFHVHILGGRPLGGLLPEEAS